MADTYEDFEDLARHERSGIDYRVLLRRAEPAFALVAPHGGGIERGTSEIADAIGGSTFSFYAFEGLKSADNSTLHITSTNFDEPMCLKLLRQTAVVVTLHGEESRTGGEAVFIGGRDVALGGEICEELARKGFDVRTPPPDLRGLERRNVCNRGTSRAGVQLELAEGLRETLFESLTRKGREHPTERFQVFVKAVRRVLGRRRD